jgi:leucyl aminopeptidase (aminopeptidase T)
MSKSFKGILREIQVSLDSVIVDTKLQIDGISGSGQITIDDELVSYEDEIVIYV